MHYSTTLSIRQGQFSPICNQLLRYLIPLFRDSLQWSLQIPVLAINALYIRQCTCSLIEYYVGH